MEGGRWAAPRSGRFTSGKDPVPIAQEAGWASVPFWTVRNISPPPGFDPRTVQARSESLCRLSYRGRPPSCSAIPTYACVRTGITLSWIYVIKCDVIREVVGRPPAPSDITKQRLKSYSSWTCFTLTMAAANSTETSVTKSLHGIISQKARMCVRGSFLVGVIPMLDVHLHS